jgi:BirA family biotin operon repressor/biotin-[acetyl-CoA-carboxylase] ligase
MAIPPVLLQYPLAQMTDNTNDPITTRRTGNAGWWLTCYPTATSTNDIARELPPWSAVMALRQTAGRGRLGRAFSSDLGGLWISAVLPAHGGIPRWSGFSLTIGRHVLAMLEKLQVHDARLRWPNDLMIGTKKLGGILIEHASANSLIVGLGLNLTNQPWNQDASLERIATRLADHLPRVPDLQDTATMVLNAIADAHHDMESHGLRATIDALNQSWASGREVRIHQFDGTQITGQFIGLDPTGNLRIVTPGGHPKTIEHHYVERLVEV